jgi:hypothetical protein
VVFAQLAESRLERRDIENTQTLLDTLVDPRDECAALRNGLLGLGVGELAEPADVSGRCFLSVKEGDSHEVEFLGIFRFDAITNRFEV